MLCGPLDRLCHPTTTGPKVPMRVQGASGPRCLRFALGSLAVPHEMPQLAFSAEPPPGAEDTGIYQLTLRIRGGGPVAAALGRLFEAVGRELGEPVGPSTWDPVEGRLRVIVDATATIVTVGPASPFADHTTDPGGIEDLRAGAWLTTDLCLDAARRRLPTGDQDPQVQLMLLAESVRVATDVPASARPGLPMFLY